MPVILCRYCVQLLMLKAILDENNTVKGFADKLVHVCVETIETEFMIKDLPPSQTTNNWPTWWQSFFYVYHTSFFLVPFASLSLKSPHPFGI